MTMMATSGGALTQMFERIDSAPRPHDERLKDILAGWQAKRADVTIPKMAAFDEDAAGPLPRQAFIFEKSEAASRDYILYSGPEAVGALVGSCGIGLRLTEASLARGAVRLRRLFELVGQTGEPLLAQFTSRDGAAASVVELLVAPLSSDGKTTIAFLCGVSTRPVGGSGAIKRPTAREADAPLLFALGASDAFGAAIAAHLGLDLSPVEERDFEDGERKTRPLVNVRDRECHVIASLNGDDEETVNDRLCRLLFFIGTLKTNGAARVTAVTPYICYLRKDRQTKPQDPLTGRYVAQLLEAIGADRLITMEAHNLAALQNAFRVPTIHLEPYRSFARYLAGKLGASDVTAVSPDLGGGKRADAFRIVLEETIGRPVGGAFAEKHRSMAVVTGELFAGEVAGRKVVILDDMISSGTTMARVAKACQERGATGIYLAASHALFSRDAGEKLQLACIDEILITDTVQPLRIPAAIRDRVTVIGVADLFAGAMAEIPA